MIHEKGNGVRGREGRGKGGRGRENGEGERERERERSIKSARWQIRSIWNPSPQEEKKQV